MSRSDLHIAMLAEHVHDTLGSYPSPSKGEGFSPTRLLCCPLASGCLSVAEQERWRAMSCAECVVYERAQQGGIPELWRASLVLEAASSKHDAQA